MQHIPPPPPRAMQRGSMAYLVFLGFIFAISWWLDTKRKRREARQRTAIELKHGHEEGLPAPGTAIGRKAREIADAQEQKLHNPPPVHGTARWGSADDAAALIAPPVAAGRGLYLGELDGREQKHRPFIGCALSRTPAHGCAHRAGQERHPDCREPPPLYRLGGRARPQGGALRPHRAPPAPHGQGVSAGTFRATGRTTR